MSNLSVNDVNLNADMISNDNNDVGWVGKTYDEVFLYCNGLVEWGDVGAIYTISPEQPEVGFTAVESIGEFDEESWVKMIYATWSFLRDVDDVDEVYSVECNEDLGKWDTTCYTTSDYFGFDVDVPEYEVEPFSIDCLVVHE